MYFSDIYSRVKISCVFTSAEMPKTMKTRKPCTFLDTIDLFGSHDNAIQRILQFSTRYSNQSNETTLGYMNVH